VLVSENGYFFLTNIHGCDRDHADSNEFTHGWTDYRRNKGTPCMAATDYSTDIGTLFVSRAVHHGATHVFQADADQSIEVTALANRDLTQTGTYAANIGGVVITKHRVMPIPCGGTCGMSDPASHTVSHWATKLPVGLPFDAAADGLGAYSSTDYTDDISFAAGAVDRGLSSPRRLRFNGINLPAGKYNLCFCDSEQSDSPAGVCSSRDQFTQDLGEIHVGGVYCLLSNPTFQRGTCIEAYHGGMVCYDSGFAVASTGSLASDTAIAAMQESNWPEL